MVLLSQHEKFHFGSTFEPLCVSDTHSDGFELHQELTCYPRHTLEVEVSLMPSRVARYPRIACIMERCTLSHYVCSRTHSACMHHKVIETSAISSTRFPLQCIHTCMHMHFCTRTMRMPTHSYMRTSTHIHDCRRVFLTTRLIVLPCGAHGPRYTFRGTWGHNPTLSPKAISLILRVLQ